MANVSPLRFTTTLHVRCEDEWLKKLDDLCVAERPGGRGRVPTRAEVLRRLVDEAWQTKGGTKRK